LAEPLEAASFWPTFVSVAEHSSFTVPELVFQAEDGQPLTIVVEVNPGTTCREEPLAAHGWTIHRARLG
jgi:hypothetical protein